MIVGLEREKGEKEMDIKEQIRKAILPIAKAAGMQVFVLVVGESKEKGVHKAYQGEPIRQLKPGIFKAVKNALFWEDGTCSKRPVQYADGKGGLTTDWDLDSTLVVLFAYINKWRDRETIEKLAKVLRRLPGSIGWKFNNLKSIDPRRPKGICGAYHCSHVDREACDLYRKHPKQFMNRAKKLLKEVGF